jgi:hypothetical protein
MPPDRREATAAMLPPVMNEWDMIRTTTRAINDWSAIKAPVHLFSAADSKQTTRKIAALLRQAHPHWHFHEMPSGGHMAPVAKADQFNALVQEIVN